MLAIDCEITATVRGEVKTWQVTRQVDPADLVRFLNGEMFLWQMLHLRRPVDRIRIIAVRSS